MRERRFSNEDYKEWARLYTEEGMSMRQIAELYKTSFTTIIYGLKKLSVKFRRNNWRSEYDNWREYYLSGMSTTKIASLYGCHHSVVLRALKRMGVSIRELSEASRQHQLDEHYFDVIDNETKAYFLGFICGDGCVIKNGNSVQIVVHKNDSCILEILKKEMCMTYPISFRGEYAKLRFTSKHVKEILVDRYGIVPNKSLVIKYPKNIPNEFNRHVVRGIFDADGSIHLDKSNRQLRWSIVSGSKDFVESIQNIIVNELGLNRTLISFRKGVWCLCYSGNRQVKRIYDWLYEGADVYLPRKKTVFEQRFGNI